MIKKRQFIQTPLKTVFISALGLAAPACMVDAGGELGIDTSTENLVISDLQATLTPAACGNATGAINLTVNGGLPPFTFAWSNGATTQSLTGLSAGSYSVTVTDAAGESATATYRVGNAIAWTNTAGLAVSASGNLSKNVANGWTNSGAASVNVLDSNENGFVNFAFTSASTGRFMVGLSDFDQNINFNSIDYALYHNAGTVLIYENGVAVTTLGLAQLGDVYSIERQGSAINYYRNQQLVRTTAASATARLLVDTALYDSNAVAAGISASFCEAPLVIDTSSTRSACGTASGSASVTVTQGIEPHTFEWDTGATAAATGDLGVGSYTVTVRDAVGRAVTEAVTVGPSSPGFSRLRGVTYSTTTGTITKTASTTWGNGGGFSSGSIAPGQDGHVQFEVQVINNHRYMIGLSATDENDHYTSMDFALYYDGGATGGRIRIYENGVFRGTFGAPVVGDIYRVARIGNSIVYFRNQTALRTVAVNAQTELFADFAIYTQNGQIRNFQTTFCAPSVRVTPTISHATCGGANGSISLALAGGQTPYGISWSNGATSTSLTNLAPGNYTVTITDATGESTTATYRIDFQTDWANLTGVTLDGATQTITKTNGTGWNAGGSSGDALASGTDGSVSFGVDAITDQRYMVGLSDTDVNTNYTTIDHAIYYARGTVFVFENGTYTGVRTTPRAGDTFRVAREGSSINYYQNTTLLRSVVADTGISLIADFSVYDTGAQVQDAAVSFCAP